MSYLSARLEPTKCYAVSSGDYSDYRVHAIYRWREDAEARVKASAEAPRWFVDGEPAYEYEDLPYIGGQLGDKIDWDRVRHNDAHEEDMRVEEFDYYEGEPLPAALEER